MVFAPMNSAQTDRHEDGGTALSRFTSSCSHSSARADMTGTPGISTSVPNRQLEMLLFPDDLRREFKLWLPRLGLAAKKEITYIEDALERNEDRNQSNEGRAKRVVDRVGAERPPPAALGPRRRFYRRTAREVSPR